MDSESFRDEVGVGGKFEDDTGVLAVTIASKTSFERGFLGVTAILGELVLVCVTVILAVKVFFPLSTATGLLISPFNN